MANQQDQTIQQLLLAEKRASEKVAEARVRRSLRLKEAKMEADKDVEIYRKERERQFNKFEKKFLGKL